MGGGGHSLNAAARFMTYLNFERSCGKKKGGSGGNVPFVGKKLTLGENKFLFFLAVDHNEIAVAFFPSAKHC